MAAVIGGTFDVTGHKGTRGYDTQLVKCETISLHHIKTYQYKLSEEAGKFGYLRIPYIRT